MDEMGVEIKCPNPKCSSAVQFILELNGQSSLKEFSHLGLSGFKPYHCNICDFDYIVSLQRNNIAFYREMGKLDK